MLKNRLAALLFVTNLFFGVLSPQALAASLTAGYSVSPNKTVLTASAGESKPINITLANLHKDMSIKIGINYFNYTPKEDGSPNVDKSATSPTGIASWLSGKNSLDMSAGQNEIYTATLAVPKSTAAGAYYGLVVFNNTANINDTPIGVNVIVNVGTVTKSLSIVSLDTTKLQVTDQWSAKGQLELNLKNTGTGYFVPEKTLIEIVDNQNIVLDSIEGNPDNNGILPNNTFKFIIPVSKLLTPNKKYNARVKIFIAANEAPIVGETNIVTPPIKDAKGKVQATTAPEAKPKKNLFLIIGGGVVLLLVALLIAFLIHDRKKKRTARAVTTPNVPEPNLQVAAELGLNPATEPSSTEQPTTPPVVELPQAPETHEVTEASQEPPTQHS